MQQTNPLKAKLASGQPVLGIWSIISSPMVLEIFGLAGFDFLLLDMEHGIFDVSAIDAGVRACDAAGCSAIVRTPGSNASAAQWALDAGAHGVIVPQVSGAAEVRAAVAMTKYAPRGSRGYNPFTRVAQYANPKDNTGGRMHNDFGLTGVIVETQKSLDELDEILKTPDLDVVYVGVYDLSIVLGAAGDTAHPDVVAVVDDTVRRVRAAGKTAGVMVKSEADVAQAVALGANFLVWSVDTRVILSAAEMAVKAFRLGTSGLPQ